MFLLDKGALISIVAVAVAVAVVPPTSSATSTHNYASPRPSSSPEPVKQQEPQQPEPPADKDQAFGGGRPRPSFFSCSGDAARLCCDGASSGRACPFDVVAESPRRLIRLGKRFDAVRCECPDATAPSPTGGGGV